MIRSWLYAPGHNPPLLEKVFGAGADAVLLDLEDAVPDQAKREARRLVARYAAQSPAWVRVNRSRTDTCAADLDAVADSVCGIRIPKVESVDDVAWVAERAPGLPLFCSIETARGVLHAAEIASHPTSCDSG